MERPRRKQSAVKYSFKDSSTSSQESPKRSKQKRSRESMFQTTSQVAGSSSESGSEGSPMEDEVVIIDASDGEVKEKKQKSIMDFTVDMKTRRQQQKGSMKGSEGRTRPCRSVSKKNYREMPDSDDDVMIIEENDTRKSERVAKMPASSSSSSSGSGTTEDSDSDSMSPRRPRREGTTRRETCSLSSSKSIRDLVSQSCERTRLYKKPDGHTLKPFDKFRCQSAGNTSKQTSSCLQATEELEDTPTSKRRRTTLPSSDDSSDCEKSQEKMDTSNAGDTDGSQSPDSDSSDVESVEYVETAEDTQKILAFRKKAGVPQVLVKLKERGYRHTQWFPLKAVRPYKPQLLSAFLSRGGEHIQAEDAIDESWTQVERIIGKKCTYGGLTKYLVKWKGLPYMEATWEEGKDLKEDKCFIYKYLRYNKFPKRKEKPKEPVDALPKFQNGRQLREYQEVSVKWMLHNCLHGINCILGDEMGLGKTAQAIAVLEYQRQFQAKRGPFLVIAPLTTLTHWQREIETWTDMYTIVYNGSKEDLEVIEEREFSFAGAGRKGRGVYKFNVLITAYGTLRRATRMFKAIEWETVIVDEAHKLKSTQSLFRGIVDDLHMHWLLLLTGTPLQNNLTELFSLMNLLSPEVYPSLESFLERFGDKSPTVEQVKDLQNELRPLLLRRMKEDVETLPLKEEILLKCPLTPSQRIYYKAIYSKQIHHLLEGASASNMPQLQNLCMELRKVCNHPFLCNGVEEDMAMRQTEASESKPDELEMLVHSSGKMYLLDQLLVKLKKEDHRVLVFSQFTMMLDVIEDYLNLKGYGFERIDGSVPLGARQQAIDRFTRENKENFVFLLSTRAGGSGITLTAADTVIIYDSDWNPQNDFQAMARCHRIGQDKDVIVYRMISWDTYEQHLFEIASRKYGLEEAILGKYDMADPHKNNKTIFSLLQNGAHVLASEEEGKAFVAEDIDQIMKNRSEKRQIGSRAGNTFSEVTFNAKASDNRDYWAHLLPDAVGEMKNKVMSPMGKRRAKRRINYYEASRRDKGSKVSEDSDSYHAGSDASGDKSSDDEAVQGVSAVKDHQTRRWALMELRTLFQGYMAFGIDRYNVALEKPDAASLQKKPRAEIKEALHCIQEVLKKVATTLDVSDGSLLNDKFAFTPVDSTPGDMKHANYECLRAIYTDVGIPAHLVSAFENKALMKTIHFKGKQFWEHLKQIEAVGKYVEACRLAPDSEMARLPSYSKLDSTKFKKDCDITILNGVYKHGFSCWYPANHANLILEDKELGVGKVLNELYGVSMKSAFDDLWAMLPDQGNPEFPPAANMASVVTKREIEIYDLKARNKVRRKLIDRIRRLLEAFVQPPTSTLVNRMNTLNVKSAEEPKRLPTISPKSPSKLIPMLNSKDTPKPVGEDCTPLNMNKKPKPSIFPTKLSEESCINKPVAVKAASICLISDSDSIFSVSEASGAEDVGGGVTAQSEDPQCTSKDPATPGKHGMGGNAVTEHQKEVTLPQNPKKSDGKASGIRNSSIWGMLSRKYGWANLEKSEGGQKGSPASDSRPEKTKTKIEDNSICLDGKSMEEDKPSLDGNTHMATHSLKQSEVEQNAAGD